MQITLAMAIADGYSCSGDNASLGCGKVLFGYKMGFS